MLPVAAHALLQSIDILARGAANFSRRCVQGLEATPASGAQVGNGLMTVTALVPLVGYEAAAAVAKEAAASGGTVAEAAARLTGLSAAALAAALDPVSMV